MTASLPPDLLDESPIFDRKDLGWEPDEEFPRTAFVPVSPDSEDWPDEVDAVLLIEKGRDDLQVTCLIPLANHPDDVLVKMRDLGELLAEAVATDLSRGSLPLLRETLLRAVALIDERLAGTIKAR